MTDRPIPFTAPMVAALLAGTKTQTRRILKDIPCREHFGRDIMDWGLSGIYHDDENTAPHRWWIDVQIDVDDNSHREFSVGYGIGDCLWVREAYYQYGEWRRDLGKQTAGGKEKWAFVPLRDDVLFDEPHEGFYLGRSALNQGRPGWYKRLGRFMPRSASRMTLIVTDVRVQRLQEISEEDALKEGVPREMEGRAGDEIYCPRCDGMGTIGAFGGNYGVIEIECAECDTAVKRYHHLWEHINGPGSWDANPWIVAISFTVEYLNIDAPAEAVMT